MLSFTVETPEWVQKINEFMEKNRVGQLFLTKHLVTTVWKVQWLFLIWNKSVWWMIFSILFFSLYEEFYLTIRWKCWWRQSGWITIKWKEQHHHFQQQHHREKTNIKHMANVCKYYRPSFIRNIVSHLLIHGHRSFAGEFFQQNTRTKRWNYWILKFYQVKNEREEKNEKLWIVPNVSYLLLIFESINWNEIKSK